MKAKHIFIALGIVAVGVTAIVLLSNRKSDTATNNKTEEEPKGEGEVSAHTKKNTTITFTRG